MVTRAGDLELSRLVSRPPRRFSPWAFTDVSPFLTRFEHADEAASPGVYRVALPDVGSTVSLAVSGTHAGVHTWTCGAGTGSPSGPAGPVSGPCVLTLDVCHRAHDGPCGGDTHVALAGPGPLSDGSVGWSVDAALNNTGDFSATTGGVRLFFHAEVGRRAGGGSSSPGHAAACPTACLPSPADLRGAAERHDGGLAAARGGAGGGAVGWPPPPEAR